MNAPRLLLRGFARVNRPQQRTLDATATRCLHSQRIPIPSWPCISLGRPLNRSITASSSRYHSTAATAPSVPSTPDSQSLKREETPAYEMTFTCKVCTTRSSHKISKQGYHHGTVLIQCPGCKNRHLIADHLKIFSDKRITLEDIMKEKGQLVKMGRLDAESDVEFWDDGTSNPRETSPMEQNQVQDGPKDKV